MTVRRADSRLRANELTGPERCCACREPRTFPVEGWGVDHIISRRPLWPKNSAGAPIVVLQAQDHCPGTTATPTFSWRSCSRGGPPEGLSRFHWAGSTARAPASSFAASNPSSRATMLPCESMNNVVGVPRTWYLEATAAPFWRRTCLRPSPRAKPLIWSAVSLGRVLTARTIRPFFPYLSANWLRAGASARQGGQARNQKLRTTPRPRSFESVTASPSTSLSVKSGAIGPRGCGAGRGVQLEAASDSASAGAMAWESRAMVPPGRWFP